MIQMNVPNVEFAELMSRWVMQSDYVHGKSGGPTNCDLDSPDDAPMVSMEPFKVKHPFRKFSRGWQKQPYFESAKPMLSRLFSAFAAKYGHGWQEWIPAAKLWYRFGIEEAKFLVDPVKKLVDLNKPLIMYGRDCLALYRMIHNRCDVFYVEGMSRAVALGSGWISWNSPERLSDGVRFAKVRDLITSVVPLKVLKHAIHVDTGFRGSIPVVAIRALEELTGSKELPRFVDIGYNSNLPIRMLSSDSLRHSLGCDRKSVVKSEYRPKLFFRPTSWRKGADFDYPDLRVSGDAAYAACFVTGVMAYASATKC